MSETNNPSQNTAHAKPLPSVASIKLNSTMSDAEIASKYGYNLNDLKKSPNYSQGTLQDAVPKDSGYYQRYAKFANNQTGFGWTVGVVRGYQDSFEGVRQIEHRTKYAVAKSAYQVSQDTKNFFDKVGDFTGRATGWVARKTVSGVTEAALSTFTNYSDQEIQNISREVGLVTGDLYKNTTHAVIAKSGEWLGEGAARLYSANLNATVDAASSGAQGALVGSTFGPKGAAAGAIGSIAVNEVKSIFTNESTGIVKNFARSLFNSTESEVQTRRADVQVQELKNKISESVYHQNYREGKYVNDDGSTNFDGGRFLGAVAAPGFIFKAGVPLLGKTAQGWKYAAGVTANNLSAGAGISLMTHRVVNTDTNVGGENDQYWATKGKYAFASGIMTTVAHGVVSGINNIGGSYLLSKGVGSYGPPPHGLGQTWSMSVPPFVEGLAKIAKLEKVVDVAKNVTDRLFKNEVKQNPPPILLKASEHPMTFSEAFKVQMAGRYTTSFAGDVGGKLLGHDLSPKATKLLETFTSSTNANSTLKVFARSEGKKQVDQPNLPADNDQSQQTNTVKSNSVERATTHKDQPKENLTPLAQQQMKENKQGSDMENKKFVNSAVKLEHQVKPGEGLLKIAKQHTPNGVNPNTTAELIFAQNKDAFHGKDKVVQPNVMLKIPSPDEVNAYQAAKQATVEQTQKPVDKNFINSSVKLEHQVKPGESLSSIAKMHTPKGTSITPMMEAIEKANADAFKGERKVVQPNVMLKIPTLAEAQAQASKPTQQNTPAAKGESPPQHEQKHVSDKPVVDKHFVNSVARLQHQVKPGESLSSIAKMHTPKGSPLEPTMQAIEKANPDAFKGERKVVQPYTMLTIPKDNKQTQDQTSNLTQAAKIAACGIAPAVCATVAATNLAMNELQKLQENPNFQAGNTACNPLVAKTH